MTEAWRLLDLGVIDPYESQAMEEVLIEAKRKNLIPNTLFIRIPERYVEVGSKTSLSRVNMKYCHDEGIPVVREGSIGGSVVIYGEDTLICELVSDPVIQGISLNLKLIMGWIVKGLQFMGLNAHIRLKPNGVLTNDILVAGKKISTAGGSIVRGVFLAGGSVIIDFDYDFCEKAIMPCPEKFADKKAKSHREWVTTLKTQLGREVSYSEVVSALRKGFEEIFQVKFEVSNHLTEAEEQILEDLLVKYRSDEWLKYGKWSPVKDYWRPK